MSKAVYTLPQKHDRCVLNMQNGHDRLVAKYRLMHRRIAAKILENPALLKVAKDNLHRWIVNEKAQFDTQSKAFLEWHHIFDTQPLSAILEILKGETYETDRLQHSSPFCGILTEEERITILTGHEAVTA